ncbi:hypothetical protein GLP30_20640 [Photobacterium phosphoreum]|uniref:Uncharacterized protein n=1 Tax=Photobacterium phosphoreum TaxID=659 RepID=A0AAW4ZZS0_PHOPO|nr:hypothetical protein [Photobacterium phosphoreum]MCD9493192.1 hypothetical protein [Photobacterium phosphoreum]MCF2192457.1 hypothetical protein [Photobacterium phosphoreum]MCF2304103.1 hypothetical protein [Photobacterium phosphoreum]
MKYHFDSKVKLSEESEYKNLYKWFLQEVNDQGAAQDKKFIPYNGYMNFSASELRIERKIDSYLMGFFDDDQPQKKEIRSTEIISGVLHNGFCRDGKELDGYTCFKMIGTNRKIERISLIIEPIDDGGKEGCKLDGIISYSSDSFTQDDFLLISFYVKRERFDMLAKAIDNNSISSARISINKVSGFYASWSPDGDASLVKVLTHEHDEILTHDNCDIEPPRLGFADSFDIFFVTRCPLNFKQDYTPTNVYELFKDEETEIEPKKNKTEQLLYQIAASQAQLTSLKKPLWLIVILLSLLVVKAFF